MQDVFKVNARFSGVTFDGSFLAREIEYLADELLKIYVASFQIALIAKGAKASGSTLRSVRGGKAVRTATQQKRQVIANRSLEFIDKGRRKGAKMPVRVVAGVTKRGGLLYEPFPELMRWLISKGIPRKAWFPLMRAISRRGIQPKFVRRFAQAQARPQVSQLLRQSARRIKVGLINGRARVY